MGLTLRPYRPLPTFARDTSPGRDRVDSVNAQSHCGTTSALYDLRSCFEWRKLLNPPTACVRSGGLGRGRPSGRPFLLVAIIERQLTVRSRGVSSRIRRVIRAPPSPRTPACPALDRIQVRGSFFGRARPILFSRDAEFDALVCAAKRRADCSGEPFRLKPPRSDPSWSRSPPGS
jgi:hypothetical protein